MADRPKAAASGTRFDPNAAAAATAARKKATAGSGFHISLTAILLIAFAILAPAIFLGVKYGPSRAADQWRELKPQVEGYVSDVVLKVCMEQYKGVVFDAHIRPPKVQTVIVDEPLMMLSLPSEINFDGGSTEGYYKGTYDVKKKSFVVDINVNENSRTIRVVSHVDEKGNPIIDSEK
jgi:hypothetical protein